MKKRLIKKIAAVISAFSIALCGSVNVFADENMPVPTTEPAFTVEPESILMPKAAAETVKMLKLRVMLGTTYINDYDSSARDIPYVDIPFRATWHIGFEPSYTYITNLPIDMCTTGLNSQCINSVCGSGCTNETNTSVHHKNAIKNKNLIKQSISSSGYDIMLTLVSSPMCYILGDGTHSVNNALGMTLINDNYTIVSNASSRTQIERVRVIQHEISHMYGCVDNDCTPGKDCVIKGSYDTSNLITTLNIWCPNCQKKIENSLK